MNPFVPLSSEDLCDDSNRVKRIDCLRTVFSMYCRAFDGNEKLGEKSEMMFHRAKYVYFICSVEQFIRETDLNFNILIKSCAVAGN